MINFFRLLDEKAELSAARAVTMSTPATGLQPSMSGASAHAPANDLVSDPRDVEVKHEAADYVTPPAVEDYENLMEDFEKHVEVLLHCLQTNVITYKAILEKIISITKNPACHDFVGQRGKHSFAYLNMTKEFGATMEEEMQLERHIRQKFRYSLTKGKEQKQVSAVVKFYVNSFLMYRCAPYKFWKVFDDLTNDSRNDDSDDAFQRSA